MQLIMYSLDSRRWDVNVLQPKQEYSKSTWNHALQCLGAKYAAEQVVLFVWSIRSRQTHANRKLRRSFGGID